VPGTDRLWRDRPGTFRFAKRNTPADKIAANGQLDSALGRLLVIVENYPQLKSNENFMRLQDELAGTENRIAIERRRYNDVVQDYKHLHFAVPQQSGSQHGRLPRNDAYFKTDAGARQTPKVNFDYPKNPGAATLRRLRHRRQLRHQPIRRRGFYGTEEIFRASQRPLSDGSVCSVFMTDA